LSALQSVVIRITSDCRPPSRLFGAAGSGFFRVFYDSGVSDKNQVRADLPAESRFSSPLLNPVRITIV